MDTNYFVRYLPLLIHFAAACLLALGIVTISTLIGQHKANKSKMSPYECGMEPIGDIRQRFSVKFYLVAMLFILFDVEAVFLFAWAIALREAGWAGYGSIFVFNAVLMATLAYLWRTGALSWAGDGRSSASRRSAAAGRNPALGAPR